MLDIICNDIYECESNANGNASPLQSDITS